MKTRGVGIALAVLSLLAGVGVVAVAQGVKPPAVPAFYDIPADLGEGPPGEIIRVQPMDAGTAEARTWRLLYRSTDASGAPAVVSGMMVAPAAEPPPEGYPLVVVGHGTVGINRGCAPSIDPFSAFKDSPSNYALFVEPFVESGYAVIMSDYAGLGTAGRSSYLVGTTTGQNVLDSARAALRFEEIAVQPEVVIWGQSQGGHAALFAAHMAPVYAPELTVLGVVAEAPAANPEAILTDLTTRNERGGLVALPLMVADAWLPGDAGELSTVLTDRGTRALEHVVRRVCLVSAVLATQLARPSDLLRPDAIARIAPLIAANTPATDGYAMPVFIALGDADFVIPASTNRPVAERMCAAGVKLTFRLYPSAGHLSVVDAARDDVLAWMAAVRSGDPPGSTCG